MTMTPADFANFEALVKESSRQTEVECGNYLHNATSALVRYTPSSATTAREDRNYFGSSDFIITSSIVDGLNQPSVWAFIWEIKAPQCYLMENDDNKSRYRPTKDLIKAENQLIHYTYLAQQDDSFRRRYNVMDRRKIQPGGIIIGRSVDRFARGAVSDAELQNAKASLAIREEYFYVPHHIKIYTWDTILEYCRP